MTRLHGGKGSINQQVISKFKPSANNNDNDEDADNDDDDEIVDSDNDDENGNLSALEDLDSHDETIDEMYASSSSDVASSSSAAAAAAATVGLKRPSGGSLPHPSRRLSSNSSSSWSFRKKSAAKKSILPRPNVAIRVAKVAYYNSKASHPNSSSAHNPFKSQIFSSGGLRGNFFSQERLQLHSCRIQMKITSDIKSSASKTKDENDDLKGNSFSLYFNFLNNFKRRCILKNL